MNITILCVGQIKEKYFPLFFYGILSTIGAWQRWTAADSRRRAPLHFMVPGGQKKEE